MLSLPDQEMFLQHGFVAHRAVSAFLAAHLHPCSCRAPYVFFLTAVMIIQHLPLLTSKNIVLASASPRRLQLLQLIGLNPRVVTSNFEENLPKSDYNSAADYAIATSKGKALEVAHRLQKSHQPADLVIGSDTAEQPSASSAYWGDIDTQLKWYETLLNQYGLSPFAPFFKTQILNIVLWILVAGLSQSDTLDTKVHTFSETTAVQFGMLTDQEIAAYIATGETYGKAGAYGIQGAASVFVKSIQGDYFNVMGFPLHSFSQFVAELISQGQL